MLSSADHDGEESLTVHDWLRGDHAHTQQWQQEEHWQTDRSGQTARQVELTTEWRPLQAAAPTGSHLGPWWFCWFGSGCVYLWLCPETPEVL